MLSRSDIEAAYRSHGHSVLRRAERILGDRKEAEEVLQEIFTSLVERPSQFAGKSSILTFLYGATTHRALNRLRDRKNRLRLLDENRARVPAPAASTGAEERARVEGLLLKVPAELAEVAIYAYFDEMTHAEIAEVIGCSRRHVGDLLVRFNDAARALEEVA